MYRKDIWTEDRIEELKRRWSAGDSATMIAKAMSGPDLALSRNAIMGKVYRLGLEERVVEKKEKKPKPLVRSARVGKTRTDPLKVAEIQKLMDRAPTVDMPVTKPDPLNMTLLELNHDDCRWPVSGEKEHMLFCGHTVEDGSHYCAYHHRLSIGAGTRSERMADYVGKKAA